MIYVNVSISFLDLLSLTPELHVILILLRDFILIMAKLNIVHKLLCSIQVYDQDMYILISACNIHITIMTSDNFQLPSRFHSSLLSDTEFSLNKFSA